MGLFLYYRTHTLDICASLPNTNSTMSYLRLVAPPGIWTPLCQLFYFVVSETMSQRARYIPLTPLLSYSSPPSLLLSAPGMLSCQLYQIYVFLAFVWNFLHSSIIGRTLSTPSNLCHSSISTNV